MQKIVNSILYRLKKINILNNYLYYSKKYKKLFKSPSIKQYNKLIKVIYDQQSYYHQLNNLMNYYYNSKEGVYIDVGSNIGYTIFAVNNFVAGISRVLSFEPVSSNLNYQLENNSEHKNITYFNLGCGNKLEHKNMVIPNIYDTKEYKENTGNYSYDNDKNHNKNYIISTKLDNLIDTILLPEEKIKLLKIDTEGYEFEVLKGCKQLITSFKPMIIFEINHNTQISYHPIDFEELFSFFESIGYEAYSNENLIFSKGVPSSSADLLILSKTFDLNYFNENFIDYKRVKYE